MFQRILVPVDGSTFSEHAIPYATSIAAASDASLELALVHISYRPVTADISLREAINEWERDHRHREADYLHALADRVTAETGCSVERQMLNGDVVPALEHEVKQRDISLVVMTTHGRAGIERAWLGSVADALVRHVEPPVLVIRPSDHDPARTDEHAPRFTHVLIALDGSARAERAIPPALALARANGAKVTLLRTVTPPQAVTSPFIPHAVQLSRGELASREQDARAYIDDKVRELEQEGIDVSGDVMLDFHPAHALLQYAEMFAVDLIALGTHGRGPLSRMLLGSVTDKVVRAADVPVLIC